MFENLCGANFHIANENFVVFAKKHVGRETGITLLGLK